MASGWRFCYKKKGKKQIVGTRAAVSRCFVTCRRISGKLYRDVFFFFFGFDVVES